MSTKPTVLPWSNWSPETLDKVALAWAIVIVVVGGCGLPNYLLGNAPQFRPPIAEDLIVDIISLIFWADMLWIGRKRFALVLGSMLCLQVIGLLVSVAALLPSQWHVLAEASFVALTLAMMALAGAHIIKWIQNRTRS